MRDLLLVCLGGAVGSGARHLISSGIYRFVVHHRQSVFPWGTLSVNLLGSFLLGALLQWHDDTGGTDTAWRMLLGVGALGGFTTYSTFNYETLSLLDSGHYGHAALNATATFVLCLFGGAAGIAAGRALAP